MSLPEHVDDLVDYLVAQAEQQDSKTLREILLRELKTLAEHARDSGNGCARFLIEEDEAEVVATNHAKTKAPLLTYEDRADAIIKFIVMKRWNDYPYYQLVGLVQQEIVRHFRDSERAIMREFGLGCSEEDGEEPFIVTIEDRIEDVIQLIQVSAPDCLGPDLAEAVRERLSDHFAEFHEQVRRGDIRTVDELEAEGIEAQRILIKDDREM
jgi:hypothetical protein